MVILLVILVISVSKEIIVNDFKIFSFKEGSDAINIKPQTLCFIQL